MDPADTFWRDTIGAQTNCPAWSSGMLDAATRTIPADALWRGLYATLGEVSEPNLLHWNLAGAYWIATRTSPPIVTWPDVPPGPGQAMLLLRFLPVADIPVRNVLRAALAGVDIGTSTVIDGKRYSSMPFTFADALGELNAGDD